MKACMYSFMQTCPVWPTNILSQSEQGIRYTTPFCWSGGTGSFGCTRTVQGGLKACLDLRGVRTLLIAQRGFECMELQVSLQV